MVSSTRRIATALLALGLAGLIWSCSADPESEEVLTINAVVEEPPSDASNELRGRIEERKVACMAEAGFEYQPYMRPRFEVSSSKARVRGALLTESDREWAQTYGYGLTASWEEEAAWFDANPNKSIQQAFSPAEAATYGEAFDVCASMAQEEAGISLASFIELSIQVDRLLADLETQIMTDPRLADATESWVECMAQEGHNYRRLTDPRDALASRLFSFAPDEREDAVEFHASVKSEEIQLAIEDLNCRTASGISDQLPTVIEEADSDFVEQNRELLQSYYDARLGS